MSYIESKIEELTTKKQEIEQRLTELTDELIKQLQVSAQSSITASQEYVDLERQWIDIENRLWYLRNPSTQVCQLHIERIRKDIKAHEDKLEQWNSTGLKITRPDGTTMNDFYANHIKQQKKALAELEELKKHI